MPFLLILLLIPILIIFGFLKALAGIINEMRHPPRTRASRSGHPRAAQRLRRNQEVRHFSGSAYNEFGEIADERRRPGFTRHGEIEP